jgi:putative membrane protein
MFLQMDWSVIWAHMGGDLDHMSNHMGDWGWGWMALFWLFSILVVALAVWGVWAVARRGSGHPKRNGAVAVLEERFARGDITPEEYRERREVLEEQ